MPLGLCAFEWLFIYEGIPSTDRKYQEEIFHVKWKVDFVMYWSIMSLRK